MWKKKLDSLTSLSTNLLRRNRIPPPWITVATSPSEITSKQSPLLKFAYPLSSSLNFQIQGNSFSRVLQAPRLHLGLSYSVSTSTSTSPANLKCWNCNALPSNATPFLVCQSCRSVQPVDHSVDFFKILGVEKRYDIKVADLEGKYKDWQKKIHPDIVHTKSQKEREYAAEQSARVIDAYRTLTDPLSRAVYILKLEGFEVDEEARISDLDLLAEIMEIREAVEEAADTEALNHIQEQVQDKFEYWSKAFADAFERRKSEEAEASIQRMTYYKRAKEEIIKKL